MMSEVKKLLRLLRDFPLFILIGIGAGFLGYLFRLSITWAGTIRHQYPRLIFLLPVVGVLVTVLYQLGLKEHKNGPKTVISAIRDNSSLKGIQIPLVFFASILTHLTGGSAGREGAVLEMGGVLGDRIVSLLHYPGQKGRRHHAIRLVLAREMSKAQRDVAILCGMAGAFSALFVTPLTAVFFVLEITESRQILHRFIPVFTTSIISFMVVCLLGWKPYQLPYYLPEALPAGSLLRAALLATVCSPVGYFFCMMIKGVPHIAQVYIKWDYLRAFLFSVGVIIFTFFLKTDKFNGLGTEAINDALLGKGGYTDFFWKTILTAMTLAAGLKGGEIIPAIFVGATFGAAYSPLFGFPPDLGAAVGLVGCLSATAKVPIAAVLLGVELFGGKGIIFYAIASVICYFLSGKNGLYR